MYPKQNNELLVPMYSEFVHILILSLILCNNVRSLSSSRGPLINVNVFSVTFGFDPRPVSSRIRSTLSLNLLHHLTKKFNDEFYVLAPIATAKLNPTLMHIISTIRNASLVTQTMFDLNVLKHCWFFIYLSYINRQCVCNIFTQKNIMTFNRFC